MPRRVKPHFGSFGAICARGAEETDAEFFQRSPAAKRGERGHLLTDAQFADLVQHHFANCDLALLPKLRAALNDIRQFYLKSWLYREATPTRAQINAALKALSKYIAAFLAAFSAFDAVASWLLVEEIPSEFVRACECS